LPLGRELQKATRRKSPQSWLRMDRWPAQQCDAACSAVIDLHFVAQICVGLLASGHPCRPAFSSDVALVGNARRDEFTGI
jgi:hypothetical protein